MLRLILISVFAFLFSTKSYAMSCHMPDSGIKNYPVVFKGQVVSTSTLKEILPEKTLAEMKDWDEKTRDLWLGKPQVTKFKVLEGYKGELGDEMEIYHRSAGSMFGATYIQGETYLIYARKDDEGHLSSADFCVPGGKLNEIKKGDKFSSQLEVFKQQADAFKRLVSSEPTNQHFYFEQAAFLESYKDYSGAEKAYKAGMKMNYLYFSKNHKGEVTDEDVYNTISAESLPFISGYGRTLYFQEKYEEALIPLLNARDEESNRLYKISLIKLKRFNDLENLDLDLSNIQVEGLDLSGARLSNLNLSGARIKKLTLNGTILENADFSKAQIQYGTEIKNSSLKNANFSNSEISGETIVASDFSNSHFYKAKLYFGEIDSANFMGADLSQMTFTSYHSLTNSNFTGANLRGLNLSGCQFKATEKKDGKSVFSADFKNATYDSSTRWPPEFLPDNSGANLAK